MTRQSKVAYFKPVQIYSCHVRLKLTILQRYLHFPDPRSVQAPFMPIVSLVLCFDQNHPGSIMARRLYDQVT